MSDGFVNPAKRDCVALHPEALRALNFELFASPSNLDFLRDHDE